MKGMREVLGRFGVLLEEVSLGRVLAEVQRQAVLVAVGP
jgi:hypothetical protein